MRHPRIRFGEECFSALTVDAKPGYIVRVRASRKEAPGPDRFNH